jgi:dihydrofolate synthase/folylpolyglutamate synthase
MTMRKQIQPNLSVPAKKIRSYQEVVQYLNEHWNTTASKSLVRIKELDAALQNPSKKVSAILVGGTNGKSITIGLAAKLLREEGLKIGTFTSPHILTYNERFTTNLETIDNASFADIGNKVINAAETLEIEAHSYELLTLMALLYFVENKVDVALLEASEGGTVNAVNICNALVATITRVTPHNATLEEADLAPFVYEAMGIVKKGTWIVSGDQNKANLELMHKLTLEQGGHWAMPIRKLAPLSYPFEQLHGRCAALAERISHMFIEHYFNKNATITTDSLLSRRDVKRGRPTLEDKRKAELKPQKSVEQFWKNEKNELPGRFELVAKETPAVLLDTSSNLDAFKNLLLGIRLLHYAQPHKGFALVMAASEKSLHNEELLKLVRYFFKKTSGQIFICPIEHPLPGVHEETSWNPEKVANDIKSMKVKARAFSSFKEAFEAAKNSVDERQGLICVTGSHSAVSAYWRYRGINKF